MNRARRIVKRLVTITSITLGFFVLLMYRDLGGAMLSPTTGSGVAHADTPASRNPHTGPNDGGGTYDPFYIGGGSGGDSGNGCGACGCAGTGDGCNGSDCGAGSDSGCDGSDSK